MRTILMWMTMLGLIVGGAALEGGHARAYLQPTAAMIVFGPIAAFLFFRLGWKNSFHLCRRLLQDEADSKDALVLERVATLGYLGGALSGILGMIHTMHNLSDSSKIGAGIAVAFIGVLYGTLPALLLATQGSVRRAAPASGSDAKRYLAASVLFLLFSFMTVLYALTRSNPANYLS